LDQMRRKLLEIAGKGLGLPCLCLALLAGMKGGPDYTEYLTWARAFASGRINDIPGEQGSVTGLPLALAGHGTGLLFAPADMVRGIAPAVDFRLIGWLAAVLTWLPLFDVVCRAAGHRRTAVLICSALFIGTPLGFYSFYAASETFAHALVAWLVWWVFMRRDWRLTDWLAAGCLAGLLVAVRPFLGIYGLAAFACGAWRTAVVRRKNRSELGVAAAAALAPVAIAVIQVMLVNGWMTGSPWRSPYDFGKGEFASLDIRHPELRAFLFHPWHGLFVYHPIFAAGLAALAVIGLGSGGTGRAAALLALLVVCVHVWGQASWYCWWMGEGTYGSRAMGPAAIVLGVALGAALGRGTAAPALRRVLCGVMLVACAWSAVLLAQGHTNFRSYAELWSACAAFAVRPGFAVAAASAVLVWLASYATARRTLDGWESFIASCAVTTAFGCGIYTGWSSLDRIRELLGPARNAGWMAPAVCGILAAAWASLDCAVRPPRPLVFKAAAAGAAMVYVGCACLFARLAVDAERIARGFSPQTRRFACLCSTDLEEAREALMEYEKVGGFERRKAALRSFIEQEEGVCRLER